ncbi:MAG TPA: hypothetical protein VFA68_12725 [Terriglobales bacterium]|nr:hypothetical protein [Terriglobales bacterium]
MLNKLFKYVAVLLLILPVAGAQQTRVYREGGNWAEEVTGSLSSARNLRVKIDAGSVRIQGSSQSNITYVIHSRAYSSSEEKARQQFDHYKINAYVRGDTAWIVADWEGERPHRFSGEFTITVPRNLELVRAETEGGSVSTTDIAGRVEAQSGGGSLHLDNIGGQINAETGGGSIDVGTVGSDVTLHTGGGSIKVASAKGKIVAESGGGSVVVISGLQGAVLETGGGSIHVDRCAGRVKASTGGGSIDLGDIGGPAEIDTGGGSIRLASAKGAVRAETGGGSIELNDILSARAETGSGGIVARFVSSSGERTDSVLETAAGDIVVYLSPNLNISIRASVDLGNGHEIHSDFPDIRITTEGGDYGPKTINAEGKLNGGGPVLKVHTTTGDITFRRVSR